MTDDDERLLEDQLELQLEEQRESLSAIEDVLTADPTNSELLGIKEELISAMRDAEEGLIHLKRARLLQEVDLAFQASVSAAEETDVKPLATLDLEAETLEEPNYAVGSKCRFRHTDGRWYSGQIIELQGSSAKVSFLTPTSESMLMCKFFLQQRCRFGASCRLSHGANVPVSSLRKFAPIIWDQSMVGSSVWAVVDNDNNKAEIWREAEVKSWDDQLNLFEVVFRHDGSTKKLGVQSIALSEFAQASEGEESEYSSSEEYESSEYEEESISQGLGFVEMKGVQKETALFAKWENHTRGIASKMMASMGYREGMGLGVSGQGMIEPIPVKVLPPKQSLDHALQSSRKGENEGDRENTERKKKRGRGGKRKRDKKFAEAARAARQEKEPSPDMFSFINDQLAIHGKATNGSGKKQRKKEEARKEDRQSLVAYEDEVKELRVQIQKLEEMVNRNRNEKVVYEAAMRRLTEARKALEETEAAHASTSRAVMSKEKEKRWLKF